MDNETRTVAKNKANSMNERIGYPEFLKDPVELSKEYVMVLDNFIKEKKKCSNNNFYFFLFFTNS